jgi:hypothetical protein
MRDYVDVGCVPTHEDCAQVRCDDCRDRAYRECRAYIRQLRRLFGDEPDGALLSVRTNPHDFGAYFSVVCYYDEQIPESIDYAFRCECESPRTWDDQARRELAGKPPSTSS